ncbi:MAG: lactate dehydrogenase [Candidatus Caldatribacteriota bacterium]|nr:lactate dehydrogenase [Candidatus Caldatribacteriota bacterium]
MFFYKLRNKVLISRYKHNEFEPISEKEAEKSKNIVYILTRIDPLKSRRYFCITDPSLMFLEEEGIHLIKKEKKVKTKLPAWIKEKIKEKKLSSINIEYTNWQDVLNYQSPSKWRIHIAGLGDVGGMLLTGLRLLGGEYVNSIGIFDKNIQVMKRWELEANQIFCPYGSQEFPEVYQVSEENIFDCDLFIFCATIGVPSLGREKNDVRMAQFEGNSKIISIYARKAREKSFKGIFAVVSDPVDLLCKYVFLISNKNKNSRLDFRGVAPEQIRGYGLGVMNARAVYYAKQNTKTAAYIREGRAYGPHGEGLIIANDVKNYNETLSEQLTSQTLKANLDVRKTGFKPFIGPALSSGSYPIIATLSGKWHYSATFMGGVFMGAKNRLQKSGIEIERLNISPVLMKKIRSSYKRLSMLL